MKKIFILFLCLLSMAPIFASLEVEDIIVLQNKIEAASISVAASYLNVPRIDLDGVEIKEGDGFLPKSLHFSASDVSTYKKSLLQPKQKGFFASLISSFSASVSPLNKKAIEKLDEQGFNTGDFIIDGDIDINGGEDVTLSTFLLKKGFSSLNIEINGNLELSGKSLKEDYDIIFSLECSGLEENSLKIDIEKCNINGNSVFIEPIVVSF